MSPGTPPRPAGQDRAGDRERVPPPARPARRSAAGEPRRGADASAARTSRMPGKAGGRVLLEAAGDDLHQPLGQAGAEGREGRGRVAQNRGGELGRGGSLERPPPARHLVEQDAEGEDVGPVVERLPRHLLGGHVGHRSHHDALARVGLGRQGGVGGLARGAHPGEAEVQDLHAPVLRHHHVGGLEVAVDDALVVSRGERLGERGGDLEDPVHREPALGDQPVERLTLDELHRQEVDAVRFLDRVHTDDAGMVESGERLRLAPEALEPLRARGHLGRQHLERDVAAELRVGGAVHLAHPAGAERGGDAVVGEGPADREAHSGALDAEGAPD